MAIIIQDTNLINTALNFASGDDVFVTEGTIIARSNGSAVIEQDLIDLTFYNAGTIYGTGDNIILQTGNSPASDTYWLIQNTASGTVHGVNTGFFLGGGLNAFDNAVTFLNHGTITADRYGAVIFSEIDTILLTNTGTLMSSGLGGGYPVDGALGIRFGTQGTINNSGSITTNAIAASASASNAAIAAALTIRDSENGADFAVFNAGLIQGASHSFYSDADFLTLNNRGDMIGTAYIIADDARLNNSGTMDGGLTIDGIAATLTNTGEINGNVALFNDTAKFTNMGLVSGDITTGSGADMMVNRGFVAGDISLGDGIDLFKGRGGTVEGTVFGEAGNDILTGGSDEDILDGGADNDELFGRDGNDVLNGGAGNDNLLGNDGDDVITGGDGIDILNGGRGDDNMNGDNDNDRLFGRDGVDNLNGGSGDDFIDGGEGNDRLVGGGGNDRLVGGDGIDTAVFTGAQADYTILVLSNGAIRVIDNRGGSPNGIDTISSVEFLNFTDAIVDVAGL